MKKAESYWKKIKPYLKMKNISKKNRRTMIKDDEGLLRGITNHVYVLPTKEKPTEEPEVFLANASEVYRRRTSLDYERKKMTPPSEEMTVGNRNRWSKGRVPKATAQINF